MGDSKRRWLFEREIALAVARWKEVNKVMELKIIFTGSTTLIGEVEEIFGKMILKKPRAIAVGQDTQGRGMIGLQILVGEPGEVEISNYSLMYDVKDEKVINLYIQATTGIIPAKDLSNVIPIKGGNGKGRAA